LLGQQLLTLHATQGDIIDREYTQLRVHALLVQLAVLVMECPELRITRATASISLWG
jgi:hypothetical protein